MSDEAALNYKVYYGCAPRNHCALLLPQRTLVLVSHYNAIHLCLSTLVGGRAAQHPAAGSYTRNQSFSSYT